MTWEPVKDWPLYLVSNTGEVMGKRFKRNLIPRLTRKGYQRIALCEKGFHKGMFIHRLVAQAFIPNPNNLPVVNHINGIKTDNRVENLEWCSIGYNQLHAYQIGLRRQHKGQQHGKAILTESEVLRIREMYKQGIVLTKLSEAFKTTTSNIGYIVRRETWTHI